MMRESGKGLALVVAIALAVGPGCVKKTIAVHSDPPGARVYLDGQEIGRTPVLRHPFHFYGVREIAVVKPGRLVARRTVAIHTPWYSWFPIDVFTELVLPVTLRDDRTYYFDLQRAEPIEVSALIRHAHQTREIGKSRIEAARERATYRPPAYVEEGGEKEFILWAPWTGPPRVEPDQLKKEPSQP
ncbi:MAG: PEGA domain-containing protein [Planctomycetota bacterium]